MYAGEFSLFNQSEKIMLQPQQEFLQEAMEYLGLTKTALAIKLNTSESIINAWLLPEGRPGFATIPEFIEDKISILVQEKKSANFFQIHNGSFANDFPGKYCDKYQFRFPTLYRSVADDEEISYTLSDATDTKSVEPIHHLDSSKDSAWVFINEHSSMNAVLGYWRAISNSNPESVSSRFKLYLFEDHLFSIYHMDKPDNAQINNIVFYQIDDNEFQIAMPSMRRKPFDDWNLIIDSDGKERTKAEIWK
jgi:hypothetical protein